MPESSTSPAAPSRGLRGTVTSASASAWPDAGRPKAYWWQQGSAGMMATIAPNCAGVDLKTLIHVVVPRLKATGIKTLSIQSAYDSGEWGKSLWCGLGISKAETLNTALCPGSSEAECEGLWNQLVQTCIDSEVAIVSNFNAGYYSVKSPDFGSAEKDVKAAVLQLRKDPAKKTMEQQAGKENEWTEAVRDVVREKCRAAKKAECPGLWFAWAPLRWGNSSKPATEKEVEAARPRDRFWSGSRTRTLRCRT